MQTYQPGDYVKAEFKDERTQESEWMWVRVDSADDEKRVLFGRLDNEPVVFGDRVRVGQRLAISYDNVREHRKASEFVPN